MLIVRAFIVLYCDKFIAAQSLGIFVFSFLFYIFSLNWITISAMGLHGQLPAAAGSSVVTIHDLGRM